MDPGAAAELRSDRRRARRTAFGLYVETLRVPGPGGEWRCCGQTFVQRGEVHRHVGTHHAAAAAAAAAAATAARRDAPQLEWRLTPGALRDSSSARAAGEGDRRAEDEDEEEDARGEDATMDVPWLPDITALNLDSHPGEEGEVLLFYHYCDVAAPRALCRWQRTLCERLQLTGKVRLAKEGLNGTVGGMRAATRAYVQAVLAHPALRGMTLDDFKSSPGGARCFADLRVAVHQEIVPLGLSPQAVSHLDAGRRLSPEEFHEEVQALLGRDAAESGGGGTLLLDCRNFYESKIGRFRGSVAPDIRKFSYFPEYVDRNLELFRGKRVLMYCTGGVRCERGSAYLRSKGVCQDVCQLQGGVHRYLERFPQGFFRGKLFVFDERYAISSNDDVIASCVYCGRPWDEFRLCSTRACRQLVLSCEPCRSTGLTACCRPCQDKAGAAPARTAGRPPEECACTARRERAPLHAQSESDHSPTH
uniref:Thiosulfate sulfurtransferase/rhodanese-like domain-containing protein 2 n=1 Tax=Petromyzon marinus TaxID=7757 RepID=A0AAJ7T3Z9_PETMA|nr:thiosulfate sulfurtransferase/rhodanese-like domain-containing protein 2 isoform X2 [Petromyzon marinus]